jgi:hypothetical protein
MDQRELANRFSYHSPDDQRARAHEQVRLYLRQMAEEFNQSLPDSDEKDTAIHKLEEAMFWANAAIARQPATEEGGFNTTSGWQVDEDYRKPVPADHGAGTANVEARYSPPSSLFGPPDDGHRRDA